MEANQPDGVSPAPENGTSSEDTSQQTQADTQPAPQSSDEENDDVPTFVRTPVPVWMQPQKTESVDTEVFGKTAPPSPDADEAREANHSQRENVQQTIQFESKVKNGSLWDQRPPGFIGPLRPRIEELTKVKTLGIGNLSTTYLVEEYKTNRLFAMKEYIKQDVERKAKTKDLVMEKYVLNKLYDCQRVARLYETFKDEFSIYFSMEYMAGGELWSLIHCWGAPSKFEIKYYFYKLLLAVEEIHSLGIVHRDLKPENIMLTEDKLDLKLIDLATSWDVLNPEMKGAGNGSTKRRVCYHFIGTPQYMPPESFHNRGSYYKTDIYALGMILYQLICGFPPYLGGEWTIFQAAEKGKLSFYEFFSEEEKDLILKMTNSDHEERISISEIKAHKYFLDRERDYYSQKLENLEQVQSNRTEQEVWILEQKSQIVKAVQSVDENPPEGAPEVAEEDKPDPSLPVNHPDNRPAVKYRSHKKELVSQHISTLLKDLPVLEGDYTPAQLRSRLKQLKRQIWHSLKLEQFEHTI